MSGLVTFSYDDRKVISDDPLKEVVQDYFQEEVVSETLLFQCIDHLKQHQKDFYPSLCSLLFLRKFAAIQNDKLDDAFRELMMLGKKESFGKSLTLQRGYNALANFLFSGTQTDSIEFKQFEKGGALFKDPFPPLLENAELGLLATYLGKEWGDEELLGRGLKLTEFFQLLTNRQGDFFPGIWIPEEAYHEELLETVRLLLQGEVTPHAAPYLRLMKVALGGRHLLKAKRSPSLMDRSLGFLKYEWNTLSLVSSFAGKKTGIASLQKNEVAIVSMGPHFAPLADSEYYGIFRPSNGSQEGFKDLSIELAEGHGKIEGWTRMVSPDEGALSQSWLHFQLHAEEEEVGITLRKSHETEQELYFVFFVHADHACVEEGETFFPKALQRFEGTSQKVFFEKGESLLEIIPESDGEMKLIPLAGGTHFWSANFLVAFSIPKKLASYSWTVK
ncbi:MAG: hypothetical protein H7A38_05280 [Chlamydiales bacterium]|nr:hypothetical protein [Chlamydiales bacterium]